MISKDKTENFKKINPLRYLFGMLFCLGAIVIFLLLISTIKSCNIHKEWGCIIIPFIALFFIGALLIGILLLDILFDTKRKLFEFIGILTLSTYIIYLFTNKFISSHESFKLLFALILIILLIIVIIWTFHLFKKDKKLGSIIIVILIILAISTVFYFNFEKKKYEQETKWNYFADLYDNYRCYGNDMSYKELEYNCQLINDTGQKYYANLCYENLKYKNITNKIKTGSILTDCKPRMDLGLRD